MELGDARTSSLGFLDEHPGFIVAAASALQLIVWTLAPLLVNDALPIDVVEGYIWGREWVIGTYKHPALPSWILEASRLATGVTGWPAYLISQVFIVATLAFVFLLGRRLLGATAGAAGTLLLFGVYYFSWPTPEFNHNLAQMPFWAAFIWALWLAVERPVLRNWLLLGCIAGASIYTKLSTGVVLLVGAAWVFIDAKARASLKTVGPWLAATTAAILIAPLIHWLSVTDFQALKYASERAHSGTSVSQLKFLAIFALMHVGLLVILGASRAFHTDTTAAAAEVAPPDRRARDFILVMSLGPLFLAVGMAMAHGVRMRPPWGTSLSIMSGLLAISLLWPRISPNALRRIAAGAFAAIMLVPLVYIGDAHWGRRKAYSVSKLQRVKRNNWPQRRISEELRAVWLKATGRPLRIVIGDMNVAGMVALDAPEVPSVMELSGWKSPWITPERLKSEGALVVWSLPGCCPVKEFTDRFPAMQGIGQIEFSFPKAPNLEPLVIGYGILMPATGS